jgi:hypothetical protein
LIQPFELEVSKWIDGQASAAISASRKEAAAEVRHDHRNVRKASSGHRQRQRIAEAEIDHRRQAHSRPRFDRQIAAVRENHRAVLCRELEQPDHALVVQSIAVHRRKQAHTAHSAQSKAALRLIQAARRRGVGSRRNP